MECKESIKIYISQKNRKATLVARYCQKNNQLQSVQWYRIQRTHKNIYKSKKEKKVLPQQQLLPGIVEKLISFNPCRGLECKEHQKRFLSPRNRKMATLIAKYCQKTNQLQSVQGYGMQRTHKNIDL